MEGHEHLVRVDWEQEHAPRCTALAVQTYADRLALLMREYRARLPTTYYIAHPLPPMTFGPEPIPAEVWERHAAYASSLDVWDS